MAQTALSPLAFFGFNLTVAAGGVAEFSTAPFSNTRDVIITNPATAATDVLWVQQVDVSGGLPGAFTTGALVPANSSLTLSIGSEGQRHPMGTNAFWNAAGNAGAGYNIVISVPGGASGAIAANVILVQNAGAGGQLAGAFS